MSQSFYDELKTVLDGVIVFSGLAGSGKTSAAISASTPDDIVFLDFDQKSELLCGRLGIPYFQYVSKSAEETDYQELLDWWRNILDPKNANGLIPLLKDRHTVIVDNVSYLEVLFKFIVGKNPAKYNVNPANVASGKFGGANPGVAFVWRNFFSHLRKHGVKRLVVTSHMSMMWISAAPTDKVSPKGNKELKDMANLYFILVKADEINKPPTALTVKEALGLMVFNPEKGQYDFCMSTTPRVPEFTWKNFYDTMKEIQAGKKSVLAPGEVWTKQELARYSEWMSPEEKAFVKLMLEHPEMEITSQDVDTGISMLAKLPEQEPKQAQVITDVQKKQTTTVAKPAVTTAKPAATSKSAEHTKTFATSIELRTYILEHFPVSKEKFYDDFKAKFAGKFDPKCPNYVPYFTALYKDLHKEQSVKEPALEIPEENPSDLNQPSDIPSEDIDPFVGE